MIQQFPLYPFFSVNRMWSHFISPSALIIELESTNFRWILCEKQFLCELWATIFLFTRRHTHRWMKASKRVSRNDDDSNDKNKSNPLNDKLTVSTTTLSFQNNRMTRTKHNHSNHMIIALFMCCCLFVSLLP